MCAMGCSQKPFPRSLAHVSSIIYIRAMKWSKVEAGGAGASLSFSGRGNGCWQLRVYGPGPTAAGWPRPSGARAQFSPPRGGGHGTPPTAAPLSGHVGQLRAMPSLGGHSYRSGLSQRPFLCSCSFGNLRAA